MNWVEKEALYYMPVFNRLPLTIVRGQGMYVWDERGRKYLDFVAGIAVNSLGHCHPVLVKAIKKQASRLMHTSNLYYTLPQLRLAEMLVKNSCLDKVFFCNSGTEATEAAAKLARRFGHVKLGGAFEIITAAGSFHGRTLAMVSASGQTKFQQPYVPLPSGFINVPYDSIEAIQAATTAKTCAVMLEVVQGEGGVNLPAEGYLAQVRRWCDQKGLLLILDEVQTGIARTGSLYAYQQFGVEPDILTLAKGLAGGFPLGALLARDEVTVFARGEHGSTFGGNPLACAAGHAVLGYILKHDLSRHAAEMGERLKSGLLRLKAELGIITGVRGMGLLLAVELGCDAAQKVVLACMDQGLLVNKVKDNALRLMPPLVVNERETDRALAIIGRVLRDIQE
jgi:acetylornithine/N-succinyldiaminopimelate aminotransferase